MIWYSSTANLTFAYLEQAETFWFHVLGTGYESGVFYVADPRLRSGQIAVGIEALYHKIKWRDRLVKIHAMIKSTSDHGVGIYVGRPSSELPSVWASKAPLLTLEHTQTCRGLLAGDPLDTDTKPV